jgi:RNA polymerase sigma factor (sigma-70 family)
MWGINFSFRMRDGGQGKPCHTKRHKKGNLSSLFLRSTFTGERRSNHSVLTCEDDLIEKAGQGDQEAFRQLWEAHHAGAMAAALRLCHHRALAEEITQGAFLLAWRGLPRFHIGSPFRPWLMRILYRHALDVMERQRTYLRPVSIDEVIELERHVVPGAGTFVGGDMQEQVAGREELRQALAQLNADQRRVIALRYGADLTEADIAQVLGWPVGTVKSRLNRARERLRVVLTSESG